MLATESEPKTKKQLYLQKLHAIDDENERIQNNILALVQNRQMELSLGTLQKNNIVLESLKMIRRINEKTIL